MNKLNQKNQKIQKHQKRSENIKKKYKTTKSKKRNCVNKVVKMFSANAAGCGNKIQSLVNNVGELEAAIVTLQETHFVKKGKLNDKLKDFEIFEAIRTKVKGGTAIAVHKSLKPMLIEEYSDEFELLVVEIKLADKEVRVMSGYGPQENWRKDERIPFFAKLEEEVKKAKLHEKGVLIQMDANSKLGPSIIKGDPHSQTDNGKILSEIIQRNALCVINADETKCEGTVTRSRITGKVKEESVIDFVVTCEEVAEIVTTMKIDEERQYPLARFTKTKEGIKVKESDHFSIITSINAKWDKTDIPKRRESYKFKDEESLKAFKKVTSNDRFLSEVFDDEEKDVEVKAKQFIKRLKYCISKSFKKTRFTGPKRDEKLDKLFERRRQLKNKKDETSTKALEEIEEMLAVQCGKQNMKIIEEACKGMSCDSGGVNVAKMWKMKKKLKGTYVEPPAAMLDKQGNIVTEREAIENIVLNKYEERLRSLEIKPELSMHKVQREELCNKRLEEAQRNETPDWTMSELETVIKQLKNNKSKDPLDLPNEIFKPENIGTDLKLAVLCLMNQIKTQQKIPSSLKYCNITSIYKNKGSKKDFENYRGVFRVVTLRSILDKLIYNDEYPGIDASLTDSNVGARKNRNIRDNIFVINAITNEAVKKKLKGIDMQIFDVYKCFDKLWAKECINDLFECGFTNNKLPLLVKENVDAQVAVKIAGGVTRRTSVTDVVMQGTVWGSLMCTTSMDKLGKLAYQDPSSLYKYKGVPVPPLGMVDDIINVSTVENTEKMNTLINTFVESKKLKLSESKCFRLHIGKDHENCPTLKVHEHEMKDSEREKYLGDIVDSNGKVQATIENRTKRGQGIITEIMSIVNDIPFGEHQTEVALRLREAMLINGMLFNSESWHGVTKANIAALEVVDQSLLRAILNAHRGTTNEFLYLETGTLPIRWIIAQRRINFLKHIMSRSENELLKKVFNAQKENPTKGDFVKLVDDDLKMIGLKYEDVESMSKLKLKSELRKRAQDGAFVELYQNLQKSTKVMHIKYIKLELQEYLKSKMTKEERNTITAVRSKCLRDIKANFSSMYKVCKHCPLQCDEVSPKLDSQEHILLCSALGGSTADLDFMHAGVVNQRFLGREISRIMWKRAQLLEASTTSSNCCRLPGAFLDQRAAQQGGAAANNLII